MCADPVILTTVAAGVFKGGAAILGGYQQAAASRYEAKVYDENARAAILQGGVAETAQRKDAMAQIATQINELGSRGVTLTSDTPLLLLGQSAYNAELDALQIRADASNKALDFRIKSAQASHEANTAITGGWVSAAGELLDSAAKLAELGKLGGGAGANAATGAFQFYGPA